MYKNEKQKIIRPDHWINFSHNKNRYYLIIVDNTKFEINYTFIFIKNKQCVIQ